MIFSKPQTTDADKQTEEDYLTSTGPTKVSYLSRTLETSALWKSALSSPLTKL